ncbi:MAG: D-alanyl-D-alanine carboxypeptidase family protein [Pseudomonadota bacterium]|nr:D-alanyl-D-alanine carboxypeptidase [Alphaproteobacteria bacterium]
MIRFFNYIFAALFIVLYQSAIHANNFAYLIVDGNSGRIMESHRADEIRPPASLTKKMTLYLIFEALRNGKITLQTRFHVSKLANSQEPSNLWVRVGETISVENIIYALVTRSANDMSVVAAEGLSGSIENFAILMNKKAQELGMTRTKFYNPTGLPNKKQITTARDMMTLARALYNNFPNEFKYFKAKKFLYNGKPVLNHNKMLNSFSGADGIKTGFTCASRFNISVSAQRIGIDGKPIRVFAVVLGGQTSFSRDKKAAELMEKAFKKLNATPRMQTVAATLPVAREMPDEIDDLIVNEKTIENIGHSTEASIIKTATAKQRKKTKKTKKPTPQKEVKTIQTSITKDPIDEILSTSARVNISDNLPAGWVKPKPLLKKS